MFDERTFWVPHLCLADVGAVVGRLFRTTDPAERSETCDVLGRVVFFTKE